jgi:pyridoxine 5-phosphate synthase
MYITLLLKNKRNMAKLSVNVNKIATIRNARGGNVPNVVQVAIDCERFGAEGITIHPRPDERHITTKDVYDLKKVVTTEYNIEGYPDDRFMRLIQETRPTQATLVPDGPDVLTSNAGWDTIKHADFLKEMVAHFKNQGIRTSIFVDPVEAMIEGAAKTGVDRIELYTEDYARLYPTDKERAIAPYLLASKKATELGIGINAGHDLSLDNLKYFSEQIVDLKEVSIGHALISESLYLGLENVVNMYKHRLV